MRPPIPLVRLWHSNAPNAILRSEALSFEPSEFDPLIKTRLLILQSTPFCNIDCQYCYLPDRTNPSRMDPAIAASAVRRLVEDDLLSDKLSVVWHAGEPLVLPLAYYEEIFSAIEEAIAGRSSIVYSMQTNATLIDDKWCEFFLRKKIRVGVSVDGPADIHDLFRRTRAGANTHSRVVQGLETLRLYQVPHHAIAVVTAAGLRRADDIHGFFRDHAIRNVGFNFDEAEGAYKRSSLLGAESLHDAFIKQMLDFMIRADGDYQVREFEIARRNIREGPPTYRWRSRILPWNDQVIPLTMITVGWNGDFSTFSPELLGQKTLRYESFRLGNVMTSGYLAATKGTAFAKLWHEIMEGVLACEQDCQYFRYCGGGAPANKIFESGSFSCTETLYCRAMIQRPLDAVLAHIESQMAARNSDDFPSV